MDDHSKVGMIQSFVKQKTEILCQDSPYAKATLARLRRGIGKEIGAFPDAWEILFAGLDENLYGERGVASYAETAIFTALTLFALHQQGKYPKKMNRGSDSFGAAVKNLIAPDGGNEQTIKRRFDKVVTAKDYTELATHARGLIQLLKANDIPLDYAKFAKDLYLLQYTELRNNVKLSWGEDYYRISKAGTDKREESANE